MKKLFTILTLFFAVSLFAAAPTQPSTSLQFTSLEGGSFTAYYTAGDGQNHLMVVKEGSPVTGLPADGVAYNANATFGTAGTEFTAAGEYVVATYGNYITVKNLKPNTVYYVAFFDYNGYETGTTEYLSTPLAGSQSTLSAPSAQVGSLSFSSITGSSAVISCAKGNGSGRILVLRKKQPVNVNPTDGVFYYADANCGNPYASISSDEYVVMNSNSDYVTVTNLEPNVKYYVAAYEYNGYNSPAYAKPAFQKSFTTAAGPTVPSKSLSLSYVEGNSFYFSFTPGNGSRRLVVMKKGARVTGTVKNGQSYTASSVFGEGQQIADSEFAVYNGTGSVYIPVTNLEPNTNYYFKIWDFDADSTGKTYYIKTAYQPVGATAKTPGAAAKSFTTTSLTGNAATISMKRGNGAFFMVIMREDSAVTAVPQNLTLYGAHYNFGMGQEVAPGQYVVATGLNGSDFYVKNLKSGRKYYMAEYEYNGEHAPVYAKKAGVFNFATTAKPVTPASNFSLDAREGNSLRYSFTKGNGSYRIIVARKGSPVTAKPVDGITYTANAAFGQGQEIAPGQFVVLNEDIHYTTTTNLDINSTYYFKVFEYNISDATQAPGYLVNKSLSGTGSTLGAPIFQDTVSAISILATEASFSIKPGDGNVHLCFMHENGPVSYDPVDLYRYPGYNSYFGGAPIDTLGNNIVYTTNGVYTFNVYNLKPNTSYTVVSYGGNGFLAPIYNHTKVEYTFTTLGDETTTRIVKQKTTADSAKAVTAKTAATTPPVVNKTTEKVLIYPNPAVDHITVRLPQSVQTAVARIYNSAGQLVLSQNITSNGSVNISRLASGMYSVQLLSNGNQRWTLPLIKQ